MKRLLLIAGVLWLLSKQSGSDPTGVGSAVDDFIGGVGDMLSGSDSVQAIADAIERVEGWIPPNAQYPRGSRAYRNNNPGNLRSAGDLGKDPDGYGMFSSYALGRQALEADVRAKLTGHSQWLSPDNTLADFFKIYAPAEDSNDPASYAATVARQIGVSVENTLSEIWNGIAG